VASEGAHPRSALSPYRRTVDGANLEQISDVIRRKPLPVTSVNPFLGQNGSRDRRLRISIDGSTLETISDNLDLRKSSARWTISPLLTPPSEVSSPRALQQNGPHRSKFANHSRRPPSTLAVPKRRSRALELHPELDNVVEPLRVNSPKPNTQTRPSHRQLPKLIIPENERPRVELIRIDVEPMLGGNMDHEASLHYGSKYVTSKPLVIHRT
jgi:hypothetical protein